MKITSTPFLLIGAASAAVPNQQQILQSPSAVNDVLKAASAKAAAWTAPLANLQHELKHLTEDARKVWDDVAFMFPEAMSQAAFLSQPKRHVRRKDSEWDFHTSGKAVQDVWVENAQGEKERAIDGDLEAFKLRTKKVDPKVLGVDTVKQYSGYLDNEEDDKHLFYWFFVCFTYIQIDLHTR